MTKYGLSGISTRNISDVAGVNDAYIYRLLKDKENLLLQAYQYENGQIFRSILYELDKVHPLPLSFREKAYMSFQRIWKMLLSDPERLTFCEYYYHSQHFKNAEEYHNEQLAELHKRLGELFTSEEASIRCMRYVPYSTIRRTR